MMRGFDSVANHIGVILLPLLLDIFLWLGPHLSLKSFFQPFIANIPTLAKTFPNSFSNVAAVQDSMAAWVDQFNLFMALRTFPVGVTSLLSMNNTSKTPLGAPVSVNAGSLVGIVGWCLLLLVLGWLIGAIYYFWISQVAAKPPANSLSKSIKQSFFLSLIWVGILLLFGSPALVLFSGVTAVSPFLGQVILFIGALLAIWLVMPVFFSAHGIFTLQMDAFRSILNSLRMMRFTLPTTGLFLLVFVVINQGLNFLWTSPAETSWWMLVGIAGHAFISTALLAASFVYYRDINAWLSQVFEQLQRQTTSLKI